MEVVEVVVVVVVVVGGGGGGSNVRQPKPTSPSRCQHMHKQSSKALPDVQGAYREGGYN